MFAWSRTWYAEKDGLVYNFEMKKQRDKCVREYGFTQLSAADAYGRYPYVRVYWTNFKSFEELFNRK